MSAIRLKIYPLGNESKKLVDDMFDKLQRQGYLVYIQTHTPFSFSVFGVWKSRLNGSKKRRAVFDIQKFNNLVVLDLYFLPF